MVNSKKVTLAHLQTKKDNDQPITMLTAYDYPGATLVDEAGVDITLVGDSLAMTVLGHPNTVSVTMDEMLHHCRAVARGTKRAFLVGDMPFLSYQIEPAEAVRNAGRFIKEADMDAVKLEGGSEVIDSVHAILNAGIPVMGHLGLTPQSATKLGGYKVQGKTRQQAERLFEDAALLQEVGCFAIVLEMVAAEVAEVITKRLSIPTIGIGSGAGCSGQVLVYHDILGLYDEFTPKFVKRYASLRDPILKALRTFCKEVEAGKFPTGSHSFQSDNGELKSFLEKVEHGNS